MAVPNVNVPERLPDFDTQPYLGSYQQLLTANIGRPIKVDYVVGVSQILSASGTIDAVGMQYVLLAQPERSTMQAVDLYSVKTVTFFEM